MGIICGRESGFTEALKEFTTVKPTWVPYKRTLPNLMTLQGTCAGMIFLANNVLNQKQGGQLLLGGLNCTVARNHFGSQKESFETLLRVPELGEEPVRSCHYNHC